MGGSYSPIPFIYIYLSLYIYTYIKVYVHKSGRRKTLPDQRVSADLLIGRTEAIGLSLPIFSTPDINIGRSVQSMCPVAPAPSVDTGGMSNP
jgi:hypothetical protein